MVIFWAKKREKLGAFSQKWETALKVYAYFERGFNLFFGYAIEAMAGTGAGACKGFPEIVLGWGTIRGQVQ